jgi:hypothetical protein
LTNIFSLPKYAKWQEVAYKAVQEGMTVEEFKVAANEEINACRGEKARYLCPDNVLAKFLAKRVAAAPKPFVNEITGRPLI